MIRDHHDLMKFTLASNGIDTPVRSFCLCVLEMFFIWGLGLNIYRIFLNSLIKTTCFDCDRIENTRNVRFNVLAPTGPTANGGDVLTDLLVENLS